VNDTTAQSDAGSGGPPPPPRGLGLLHVVSSQPAWVLLPAAGMVFLLLSLPAAAGDSCTFDEGVHLSSGYTFLTALDYRMSIDNPPLAKVFSCLPLLLLDIRWPEDADSWLRGARHVFDYQFLYGSGNDSDRILFWARVANLFWGLLLIASVYAVSRETFGPAGAFISLLVASFSPTLLGLAHLATVDTAASALFFLTVTAFDRLLRKGTPWRALACGILLGGTLASKHSTLVLLPILALLGFAWLWRHRRGDASRERSPGPRRVFEGALLAGAAWLTVWGAFGFRYDGSPDPGYAFDWAGLADERGIVARAVDLTRTLRLLPEAYLYGLKLVVRFTGEGHPAYALGAHSSTGWWWYFPLAFLVKTPTATLGLFGWGFFSVLRRARTGPGPRDFLLLPPAFFLAVAILQSVNIGLRHILPVIPFMFVFAGGIDLARASPLVTVLKERAASILLAAAAGAGIVEAPHHLAFFNGPSCLLFERHFMLVDSNLDWGQDLGRLKRYMVRNNIRDLKLSYFGAASPRRLNLRHQVLPGSCSYTAYETEWPRAAEIAPGDYVAVSASNWVGLGREDKDYFVRRLGHLKPVATVGRSILIFKVPGPVAR